MNRIDEKNEFHPEGSGQLVKDFEEEVPEDDTIIARALKNSLMVIAILVAFVVAVLLWINRSPEKVVVEEAELVEAQPTVDSVTVEPPAVTFTRITEAAGIGFVHANGAYGERLLPETMGGGVAFFDYDNDGDQDLLLINSGDWPWRRTGNGAESTRLYENDGSGQFRDITAGSGLGQELYGMGVAVGDVDADGRTDVFVTAVGPNRLFRNLGEGRFEDTTAISGLAGEDDAWGSSAAFFDYDNDGDLDLFVCNYVGWSRDIDLEVNYQLTGIGRAYGPPTNYAGTWSYLYRNDGNGRFSDVSAESGIQVSNAATGRPAGKSLGVTPFDFDGDGWMDLAVANDTVQNFLFRNRGDGTFEEIGATSGIAFDNTGRSTGAMGIDVAWYDNSDDLAVAIGNFANEMTSFYVVQDGLDVFTDEAIVSGVGPASRQALSFGLFFFDYDLDGRADMLQANGHVEDKINVVQPSQHYEQPTQLFWNCGDGCPRLFAFIPPENTGDLRTPIVGRASSYADIDADGDLDVILTQTGRAPLLLRNDQQLGHHWLRVRLQGTAPNIEAIGAQVEIIAGGYSQRRVVMPSRSYLAQVELPVTFGLGNVSSIDELRVYWPDGEVRTLTDVAVDQEMVVSRR